MYPARIFVLAVQVWLTFGSGMIDGRCMMRIVVSGCCMAGKYFLYGGGCVAVCVGLVMVCYCGV